MCNFTIDNIPFGIYSVPGQAKRLATIVNDKIIDLYQMANDRRFDEWITNTAIFQNEYLNDFISCGKKTTSQIRWKIQEVLADEIEKYALYPIDEVTLHMPIKIGDYTDFYSSEQHARNVGMMFRDPDNALLPNWKHMPIAYHGRASSITVSGHSLHRPHGQLNASDDTQPVFAPSKRMDFELEVATIIGKSNEIGNPIKIDDAEEYVFGYSLFNDWSARDIQRWEYVPLGPFLGKNFFSSMSPWIITQEALQDFRIKKESQSPPVLEYLKQDKNIFFDVILEVYLKTSDGEVHKLSESNFSNLYWTFSQQIAHHTVNGCNLNIGDVLASGTISGEEKNNFGSMLELSWGGKMPITLSNDQQRCFIEDGDTIIIKGYAKNEQKYIDFGVLENKLLPAKTY